MEWNGMPGGAHHSQEPAWYIAYLTKSCTGLFVYTYVRHGFVHRHRVSGFACVLSILVCTYFSQKSSVGRVWSELRKDGATEYHAGMDV